MNLKKLNILLADDDADDCFFFKVAVEELLMPVSLTAVHDGEQLMQLLTNEVNGNISPVLPDVLFLDLNMPRKNGFECLSEIKLDNRLKDLPVIIFSTSYEHEVVNQLYQSGAQYFIRKPSEFSQFKKIIHQTFITLIVPQNISTPTKDNFVLSLQTV